MQELLTVLHNNFVIAKPVWTVTSLAHPSPSLPLLCRMEFESSILMVVCVLDTGCTGLISPPGSLKELSQELVKNFAGLVFYRDSSSSSYDEFQQKEL